MLPISKCKYSAFISYTFADNTSTYKWVDQFATELNRVLPSRLRGLQVPDVLLAGKNGPVAGVLGKELKARVAESFAMIAVVHEAYLDSDWCVEELRHFRELYGSEGLEQRLYVVVLSSTSVAGLSQKPWWRELGADRCVWQPFFKDGDREKPVEIYLDKGIVNPDFKESFERLCDDLVKKIKDSNKTPALEISAAKNTRTNPRPRLLFGFTPTEIEKDVEIIKQRLAPCVGSIDMVDAGTFLIDARKFREADWLVLPFNNAQPMLPLAMPGGHLVLQQGVWKSTGKTDDSIIWLDMTDVRPMYEPSPEHAQFIAQRRTGALTRREFLDTFVFRWEASGNDDVLIYIESNDKERFIWEPIGAALQSEWETILAMENPPIQPRLRVRPRGLPIDELHQYSHLDDGDGFVLLWGVATADSLREHISLVEKKVRGSRVAPGMVAYLMPPKEKQSKSMPAYGWNVFRFEADGEELISVVPEENGDLHQFLKKVLKRKVVCAEPAIH